MAEAHVVGPVSFWRAGFDFSPRLFRMTFSRPIIRSRPQPGSSALGQVTWVLRVRYARIEVRTSIFPNSRFNLTRVVQDGSRVCLFTLPPCHPLDPLVHPSPPSSVVLVHQRRCPADLPSVMLLRVDSCNTPGPCACYSTGPALWWHAHRTGAAACPPFRASPPQTRVSTEVCNRSKSLWCAYPRSIRVDEPRAGLHAAITDIIILPFPSWPQLAPSSCLSSPKVKPVDIFNHHDAVACVSLSLPSFSSCS